MSESSAFPIPVDAATAAWAGPVFVVMALTGLVVLRDDRDSRDDE